LEDCSGHLTGVTRGTIEKLKESRNGGSTLATSKDVIRQSGSEAGTVYAASVDRADGTVYFGHLYASIHFNENEDFEFQEYVLRIREWSMRSGVGIGRSSRTTFMNVLSEIVQKT
jgi:hypothetical protein